MDISPIRKYFFGRFSSYRYFTCKLKYIYNINIQAGDTYIESGAGSTLLKFGLLIVLANLLLKLFLGIGLWKMAMEFKNNSIKSSQYNEEQINEGDPAILKTKNNFNEKEGEIQDY